MPLYSITNFSKDDDTFSSVVSFDPGHEVFKGHFPGQPVVPGVFLIQLLKDISGMISGSGMRLLKGGNIKFLHLIDPRMKMKIIVKGKYAVAEKGRLKVTASIHADNAVFFKFNGIFTPD